MKRRPRMWRWRCCLCLAQGHDADGLTAFEEFETHYRNEHMTKENE